MTIIVMSKLFPAHFFTVANASMGCAHMHACHAMCMCMLCHRGRLARSHMRNATRHRLACRACNITTAARRL